MTRKIVYSEPADYIPKEIRKECKLGEYNEDCGSIQPITPISEIKPQLTEIVMILDASGSMHGLEKDTIGGFNSIIESQKKEDGDAFVTTIIFNDRHKMIHDRHDIQNIRPLTENDYHTSGCTALLDAVGYAIEHISCIHKYARKEDVPAKTIFTITTDGMENASRKYSYADIKKLIESKKEIGWDFVFTGANIDVEQEASKMGIDPCYANSYVCDKKGLEDNSAYLDDVIRILRKNSKNL